MLMSSAGPAGHDLASRRQAKDGSRVSALHNRRVALGSGDTPVAAAVVTLDTTTAGTAQAARRHQRAAASGAVAFERRLISVGLFLHCTTQIVSLRAWASLPPNERIQRLASLIYGAALPLLTWLAPILYRRHRQAILLAFRVGFFSFPLLRQARGIQRVLDAAPGEGLRGGLLDLAKIAWGSRLLAVVLAPFVMPLPLLPHLLAQLYSIAVVGSNSSLCSTLLLVHRTTAARISAFHHFMSFLTSPSCAQSAAMLLRNSTKQQQCHAFLTFVSLLLGLLLPTLVMVKAELLSAVGGGIDEGGTSGSAGSRKVLSLGRCLQRGVRHLSGRSWFVPPAAAQGGRGNAPLRCSASEESFVDDDRDPPVLKLSLSCLPRPVMWWLLLCYCWIVSVGFS